MGKKQKPKRKEPQQRAESLLADIVYKILLGLSVKLVTKFRCVCNYWCSLISHPPLQHHAESLPADIVYEILLRLSVNLLTKFRCVCKHCRSLISNPSFQQDHYLRSSQQDPLVLLRSSEFNKVRDASTIHLSTYDWIKWTFVNFSKTVPRQPYDGHILSCQGLVCIWDTLYDIHIIVCNPSTRETVILQPTYGVTHTIGFGYAASKKQFKIVRFFSPNGFRRTEINDSCEIFTLGTSEWREGMPPPHRFFSDFGSPFLHGAIHLLPYDGSLDSVDFKDGIVTFDIDSENFTTGKIQLPQYCHVVPLNSYFESIYLSQLGRFLCLTINLRATLSLWLLKDYDNGDWVNEYTIDLSSFGYSVDGEALAILGDGSILLDVSAHDKFLYCYHSGEKTFSLKRKGNYTAALYVESLFALRNSP